MNSFEFDVQVKYTRRKGSIGIRVGKNGVCLLAPTRTPVATLKQVLSDRQHWIREKLALLESTANNAQKPAFIDNQTQPFLGADYRLSIVHGAKDQVYLDGSKLCIDLDVLSPLDTQTHCRQLLEQWYQRQAELILPGRLQHWSALMDQPYSSLKIRSYKSRWGSCDRFRRITLNNRLMMADDSIIDYVLIHELCHLVHLNHSAAFWELVHRYCPDYMDCRRSLRSQEQRFQLA